MGYSCLYFDEFSPKTATTRHLKDIMSGEKGTSWQEKGAHYLHSPALHVSKLNLVKDGFSEDNDDLLQVEWGNNLVSLWF